MTRSQAKAGLFVLIFVGAVITYVGLRSSRDRTANANPAHKNIVGVYQQLNADPPGTEFRLEILSDGRWAMANMMTGFWGTWTRSGTKYTFIDTDGATGKSPKPSEAPFRFDGDNTISFGSGPATWTFARMTAKEKFVIPFEGTSIEKWKGSGVKDK